MNAALFILTVLIWGTTWIAITFQIGPVPVLVSVFYRFALAGVVFVVGLALMRRLTFPGPADHPWIFLQALCLFSFNFICFYYAANYVASGVISVIFSFATIFNAVNARIFFAEKITVRAIIAGTMGVCGLALLFGADLFLSPDPNTARGIGAAFLGTLLFSFGNMVSRRNSAAGLRTVTANSWGMIYGSLVLLIIITLTQTQFVAPPDSTYILALIYLTVIGTIAGFTAYLLLVARLGSAKAAYATVLFPIVALSLSTLFEGYSWTWLNALGLVIALMGNVVMFSQPRSSTNQSKT